MKEHRYRVTIEHLEDAQSNPVHQIPLVFEARNHDNLFTIVERVKAQEEFTEDEATAFAIGLKLFGEVMLQHRDKDLFQPLLPHFGEFMKKLKQR